ncbi:hypothetical protein FZ041_10605 [Selenomonas caprae]|uniref:Uncharacterized protein n=1 Tax=Selenomonas caprae TaxID=2606905 RepID=A0A5D6WI03_9FIRM|nr:hypothetical protein [Selenomonas caprae]TYZ27686.1 hypothetical protein FZ041_10605 [Selenomonas caprae]
MELNVRVRLDRPQTLYIGDCLKREEQGIKILSGKPSLADYWQQLLAERWAPDGLFVWVPLHIAPHGIDLNADFDLSGSDVLDISLALGDFGYDRMARLWAQLYASLAWDVAREILPCCSLLGKDYIDFSTIAGRRLFENGMKRRDREHGIKRRPPCSVREYVVLQKCGEA